MLYNYKCKKSEVISHELAGIQITLEKNYLKRLLKYTWRNHKGLPVTTIRVGNYNKPVYVGNIILGTIEEVAYKDNNGLNNVIDNLIDTSLKQCTRCKKYKNKYLYFHKDSNRKDNYFPYCKSCRKENIVAGSNTQK